MQLFLIICVSLAIAIVTGLLWRKWKTSQIRTLRQQAMQEFPGQLPKLSDEFRTQAQQTGKPRGLRWKGCEFSGEPLFAFDRVTGDFIALQTATISFEAIPGGGMEDVEAVGNLRCATAIFVYRNQSWETDGKAVFNLEPFQTLERFRESLIPLK